MRLKIAALLSVALHAAALAAIVWVLVPEIGVRQEPATLHLNIVTEFGLGNARAGSDAGGAGNTDQAPAPSPAERNLADSSPPPAAAPVTGPTADPLEYVDPDARTDDAPGLRMPVPVVTASATDAAITMPKPAEPERSTLRRIPMTSTQQTMLREKLDEWIERMPALIATDQPASWEHDGQEYTAEFQHIPARDEMGLEEVLIAVGTQRNGQQLSTEMRVARLAFSHFGHFIDKWDRDIEMHDDVLDGLFHSNSTVYLNFSPNIRPVFNGKATTASHRVAISSPRGHIRRDAVFLGGLETGVPTVSLPTYSSEHWIDAEIDDHRVQYLDDDSRIIFYADGSVGWRALGSGGAGEIRRLSDKPFYLVGGEKARLHVKGVLRGRVLVYSAKKIVIEDDLTYADAPDADGRGSYLGLVCDKNIEIAAPRVTGPGDLRIDAAIYARKRFVVRRYEAKNTATFFVHGSLTAGSMSATEPRYRMRLRFDQRFPQTRPPRFPLTDRYELDSWDAHWQ